jgi:LysM repeat protein
MSRLTTIALLLLSLLSVVQAEKSLIDCRVIVGGMRECNPYSLKFLKAKEIGYQTSKKKLIVEKTLPVPEKNPHIKVVSVEEMIERYVKVEDSKRFSGTKDKAYFRTLKQKKQPPKPLPPQPQKDNGVIVTVDDSNATKDRPAKKREVSGYYAVRKGDTLSQIALMFGLKTHALMEMNALKQKDHLKIGQKLKLPLSQEMIDTIAVARYRVKRGDTLLDIAKRFGLDPKALASYNKIKSSAGIREGKVLNLPLPYIMAAQKSKKKAKKKRTLAKGGLVHRFGKHKLRVTATAYSSHRNQTDSTPFLAAWNNHLRPGMKVIAVSRDLLYKYGMRNGTKVRISGLPGIYRVRDKMNKRYKKRIDIYMGVNRRKALKWGRRSVVIYW